MSDGGLMDDLGTTVAVSNSAFRQEDNLEIAKGLEIFLNACVDLPCPQTSYPTPAISAEEGTRP